MFFQQSGATRIQGLEWATAIDGFLVGEQGSKGRGDAENQWPRVNERLVVKGKPDLLLLVMAAFGLGVAVTMFVPMANETVAAPASELQAGVIIQD